MAAKTRKEGSASALPTGNGTDMVNLDQVNPREQWGTYTVYVREHRAKNVRHWYAPRSNGETRSIAEQFRELEREGKVCHYELLYALAKEVYGIMGDLFMPSNWPGVVKWKSMDAERGSMVQAFTSLDARDMRYQGAPYGDVFYRAEVVDHEVMEPHTVTLEEAEQWNERERAEASPGFPPAFKVAGELEFVKSKDQPQRTRRERIGERWVDLFIMEVRALLGENPDTDHIAAFNELHSNLKAFEVGSKDGAPVRERLRGEGNGTEVLAAFERCRSRLLQGLDEIAGALPAYTVSVVTNGVSVQIPWKGSVQVLAWLLRELAEKDWIDAPRHSSTTTKYKAGDINASAFTKAMAPHFPVNATALGQELKAEGGTVPAQDVEDFRIPQRPK